MNKRRSRCWTGSKWHPCAALLCTEIKGPAQSERMNSIFLKRSECNHGCKRYYAHLVYNFFKWSTLIIQLQPSPGKPSATCSSMGSLNKVPAIPSVGSQRELGPKGKLLHTGSDAEVMRRVWGQRTCSWERREKGCRGERRHGNQHLHFHRGHDSLREKWWLYH